ncbi:MAG TPA: LLM class flavin-dependent oxidoreductase [Streptosporangiaceae bacterium]|nr:LLM class flavin-dependent oxidoreductase [Streptosporangiaceae bacterium]
MTALAIGLAFQTDKPPGRYGELAAAAEVLGFDVVSVFADLLYQPPLPALLEMARATSRVRLGAACQNPFTQHPYEIAGGLAVLETVSSGRAYLGLAREAWLDAPSHAPRMARQVDGSVTPPASS